MDHDRPAGNITAQPAAKPLPTLRKSLRRIHLTIILVSLTFSGISLSLLSVLALRNYAENNSELLATTISYSAGQAVATGDGAAARAILQAIGAKTQFGQARILDADRRLLASWAANDNRDKSAFSELVSRWLFPKPVQIPVLRGGKEIGTIWLTGDGCRVMHYLYQALTWLGCSMLLSALLAFYLSRRMHSGIVSALSNIACVAHEVRRRRAFSLRVPSSSIAELNKLSGDFNSLLDELADWQRHLQSENATLAHQVRHDALTGLPNRTAFEQELHKQLDNPLTAARVAVLFIDGDRFKEVNDRYGHAAGDRVLTITAQRLRARLRKGDLVARLGGDEFAVLLLAIDSGEQAGCVAQSVIEAMREPIRLDDGTILTQSLSIGIALAKNHHTGEATIAQADAAMYHIKALGGGWYFSPALWSRRQASAALECESV
ncbi:diguanylate cyclase (GGDEF)-like protein [Erwinia persicina]|jgi:diguanylate cyclase (GGDEF)-like protein|uniref:Diguanylate cyclase n=2 Tax=Erwinia TaxID=551 RepID=A0ABV4E5B8_9GAMM|nr:MULTISPECIES: diguanylate cyclase [Erwinia]MCP1438623.1 diguanylate cyclase (GGDEF)-like protein [Erwinia persicina]MDN4627738.1 diguanylate cyclase [Erwinia sp. PsM31]MDN8542250.1 diguanylate cyclase [Erwinia sp. BC051422]